MLYDQAQLLSTYSSAYKITKDDFFADTMRDIVKYVERDLQHEGGGFYSAEDADSFPEAGSKKKLGMSVIDVFISSWSTIESKTFIVQRGHFVSGKSRNWRISLEKTMLISFLITMMSKSMAMLIQLRILMENWQAK